MKNESVLVIDDDAVMRDLLPLLLATEGYNVTAAESGEAALADLAATAFVARPAIVLTDLNIPGEARPQLAEKLRRALPPGTLLIAMSASEPTLEELQTFDAFVRKPINLHDFHDALERARAQRRRPVTSGASLQPEPDSLQGAALDPAVYDKLSTVMGPDQLAAMYGMLLEDAAQRLVKMRRAVEVDDKDAFTREAHALKGASGMLGAVDLHAIAGRLETQGLLSAHLLPELDRALEQLRRILEVRLDPPLVQVSRDRR